MPLAPGVLLTWQGTETLERDVSTTLKTTFFPPKIGIWAPPNGMGHEPEGCPALLAEQFLVPRLTDHPKEPRARAGLGQQGQENHTECQVWHSRSWESVSPASYPGHCRVSPDSRVTPEGGITQGGFREKSV